MSIQWPDSIGKTYKDARESAVESSEHPILPPERLHNLSGHLISLSKPRHIIYGLLDIHWDNLSNIISSHYVWFCQYIWLKSVPIQTIQVSNMKMCLAYQGCTCVLILGCAWPIRSFQVSNMLGLSWLFLSQILGSCWAYLDYSGV